MFFILGLRVPPSSSDTWWWPHGVAADTWRSSSECATNYNYDNNSPFRCRQDPPGDYSTN